MWIFTPGGLLMPASLPTKEKDHVVADPKFTEDGKFDLQVRGRVDSHLQNFIRDYMDPLGLEHSKIQYTPKMDYNVRFYCKQEDFAKAVAQCVLDIDYLKYKPTAERRTPDGKYLMYEDGKAFHSVLNAIWSNVTRLGAPYGGSSWWGQDSRSGSRRSASRLFPSSKRTGSTQWEDSALAGLSDEEADQLFGGPETTADPVPTEDWVPDADTRAEELYLQLTDIPADQWSEFATAADLENVERYMKDMGLKVAPTQGINQEPTT
jgi:hypothetical protein